MQTKEDMQLHRNLSYEQKRHDLGLMNECGLNKINYTTNHVDSCAMQN